MKGQTDDKGPHRLSQGSMGAMEGFEQSSDMIQLGLQQILLAAGLRTD